jgi:hypothetical protein
MGEVRKPLCYVAYAILVFYVLANLANIAIPPLSPGTLSPTPVHSLHVYYPPSSGYNPSANTNDFKEININITIMPGPPITEGMNVSLSAFGIISAPLAKNLSDVVVNFLAAKGPDGAQRIVGGSSGWGITLYPQRLDAYQSFIVAGSQSLEGNSTFMEWPSGTGGISYYPMVTAQYNNGSEINTTSNDSIYVYSPGQLTNIYRSNVEFAVLIASPIAAMTTFVYRYGSTKKEKTSSAPSSTTPEYIK